MSDLKTLLETGDALPAGEAAAPGTPGVARQFGQPRRGQFTPVGSGWSR
jgi:hypothetical protein